MLHSFCYKSYFIFFGLSLCFSLTEVHAGTAKSVLKDPEGISVPLKVKNKKIFPADTLRHFRPFDVLDLSDTSKLNQQERQTKKFYQKLKESFYKRRLTREIFDLLFVAPSQRTSRGIKPEQVADRYGQHKEQIIRNIEIQKIDLFGPTVTDTTRRAKSWLQKTLNNLHISTRERVIRKNLFIEEGDLIAPEQLADNERVLRELSFIRDARILVVPAGEESDSVDILVLVQDVLPYSAGGSFRGINRSSVEISNNNLAGLGHELSNELIFDKRQSPYFGYRGNYFIPNMGGSFISSNLEFTHTDWEKRKGLVIQREFYTPQVRWAGGLQHYQTSIRRGLLLRDMVLDTIYNYSFHYSDVWGAYAFRFRNQREKKRGFRERSGMVLAARFSRTDYQNRPPVSDETQPFFHDNRLYLASIGWTERHYFRDRYLFGFGRTEDVPYGTLFNFTFGLEDREFGGYTYAGFTLTRARYFRGFGYLLGQLEAESYFTSYLKAERRLLHLNTSYYSPLMETGKYSFRQMLSVDYLYGDRRFDYEFLRIDEDHIRGFDTWEQRGTQRFSLKFESVCFTPLYILGFQFAGFTFADISFLNNQSRISLEGKDFQGYGIGFRIRNENLTFNTFQVRFSIYPGIADKSFGIRVSTIPRSLFKNFRIGKPQPLLYR